MAKRATVASFESLDTLELADITRLTLRSHLVAFGKNAVGLHAAIDTLILAGGVYTGSQVHYCFGTASAYTHTCSHLDIEVWSAHSSRCESVDLGDGIFILSETSRQDLPQPVLPLLGFVLQDTDIRELFRHGIPAYSHRHQGTYAQEASQPVTAPAIHIPPGPATKPTSHSPSLTSSVSIDESSSPYGDAAAFTDLSSRLPDFLAQLMDIELLVQAPDSLRVPSVWLMTVLPGTRTVSTLARRPELLHYRLCLIASPEQLELMGGGVNGKMPWETPTGQGARSIVDSAITSGFAVVASPWLSDQRGKYSPHVNHRDTQRKTAVRKAMRKMFPDGHAFDFIVPIHVAGVPMFALRFQIPERAKLASLSIYQCLIASLAAQLRQIMTASYLSRMRALARDYQATKDDDALNRGLKSLARQYPFPERKRGDTGLVSPLDSANSHWTRHFDRFEAGPGGVNAELEHFFAVALKPEKASETLKVASELWEQRLCVLEHWDGSVLSSIESLLHASSCSNRRAGYLCTILVRSWIRMNLKWGTPFVNRCWRCCHLSDRSIPAPPPVDTGTEVAIPNNVKNAVLLRAMSLVLLGSRASADGDVVRQCGVAWRDLARASSDSGRGGKDANTAFQTAILSGSFGALNDDEGQWVKQAKQGLESPLKKPPIRYARIGGKSVGG